MGVNFITDTEARNNLKELARKRYSHLQKSNDQIKEKQSETDTQSDLKATQSDLKNTENDLKNTQSDENKAQNMGGGDSEASLQPSGESSHDRNVEETIDKHVDNIDVKSDEVDDNKVDVDDTDMEGKTTEELMEELDVDKLVDEAVGRLAGLFEEELKKVKDQGQSKEEEDDGKEETVKDDTGNAQP